MIFFHEKWKFEKSGQIYLTIETGPFGNNYELILLHFPYNITYMKGHGSL